ncbi:Holliday junction branch migration protein RuvA, partial [Candidatus Parcubacteria bacterium]
RIVFELREKIALPDAPRAAAQIAKDADVVEALVNLGYRRREAREAVARLDPSLTTVEARLRAALAALTAAKHRSR